MTSPIACQAVETGSAFALEWFLRLYYGFAHVWSGVTTDGAQYVCWWVG